LDVTRVHLKITFQPRREMVQREAARRIVHLKQKSMLKGEADSFECPEEIMSEDEAPA